MSFGKERLAKTLEMFDMQLTSTLFHPWGDYFPGLARQGRRAKSALATTPNLVAEYAAWIKEQQGTKEYLEEAERVMRDQGVVRKTVSEA
jgi:hypothetical protein